MKRHTDEESKAHVMARWGGALEQLASAERAEKRPGRHSLGADRSVGRTPATSVRLPPDDAATREAIEGGAAHCDEMAAREILAARRWV
jgi:hypothetical protein